MAQAKFRLICFEHHYSETLRNPKRINHIISNDAPSASEVVYQLEM